MIGYSWVSIAALVCYLFLLLTFLASKKTDKVIRAFMMLMVIMICWAGGSFAMRIQLWPSVNFWHHVSVLGMMLLAGGYFHFILDFLEEKGGYNKEYLIKTGLCIESQDGKSLADRFRGRVIFPVYSLAGKVNPQSRQEIGESPL